MHFKIDKSFEKTVRLQDVIQKKQGEISKDIDLTIEVEKNVKIDLLDDLFNLNVENSNLTFVLHEHSVLRYQCALTEKPISKKNEKVLNIILAGIHADARVRCFYRGFGDAEFSLKTIQHHCASFTKSDVLIKGAFLRASTFRCDSLVKVEKDLKQVVAKQMNKNLLIGCSARVVSIPRLEVESDDVQCTHGATVAQIDSEHLFYLQSRGISFCDSKKLLIHSFLK